MEPAGLLFHRNYEICKKKNFFPYTKCMALYDQKFCSVMVTGLVLTEKKTMIAKNF